MAHNTKLLCYVLPALLFLVGINGCDQGGETDDTTVTREQVLQILRNWHDQIEPTVSEEERTKVEQYAAGFPEEGQEGIEPVSMEVVDGDNATITPVINRRDWAYAVCGIAYSTMGVIGQGQAAMIDMGFWCFLEAALLQTDESEHLANVAFHLNLHGAFDDARAVLIYARSVDGGHIAVRNNLAFAYAQLGDYDRAIYEAQIVVAMQPMERAYLERLASYYNDGGYPEAADALKAALEGIQQVPTVDPGIVEPDLSVTGAAIRSKIEELSDEMRKRGQEILDQYDPQLETSAMEFMERWSMIAQEMMYECPFAVAQEGGDPYAICVECYIPGGEEAFDAGLTFYSDVLHIVSSFECEAYLALSEITWRGLNLVWNAVLPQNEKQILLGEVHDKIFAEHVDIICGPRTMINFYWGNLVKDYEAAMAEGCGDAPVEAPEAEIEDTACKLQPALCRNQTIFNFILVSLVKQPDGTYALKLGASGMDVRLEYNFATGHAGFGVGLGINLGKPLNASASLMFRSKTGVTGGVEVTVASRTLFNIQGYERPVEYRLAALEN